MYAGWNVTSYNNEKNELKVVIKLLPKATISNLFRAQSVRTRAARGCVTGASRAIASTGTTGSTPIPSLTGATTPSSPQTSRPASLTISAAPESSGKSGPGRRYLLQNFFSFDPKIFC